MQQRIDGFTVRAFALEFPFLFKGENSLVDQAAVERMSVSRIDTDFLSCVPAREGVIGSQVDIDDSERIFLFDGDGNQLTEVKQQVDIRHNEKRWDGEYCDGESVGEALLRLDDPDTVKFAVKVHTGYTTESHLSVGGYSVTLYKAPKGFTLRSWVEEQIARAQVLVKAQVAEIDAEGAVTK